MKTNSIKNNITYFLLVIFFSMKMTGFHVLSHSDNDDDHAEHCNICDYAITHSLTPALTPDFSEYTLELIPNIEHLKIAKNYSIVVASAISKDQLFSRPPPFLF